MNPWLEHVKNFQKANPNLSYKECLSKAKQTYKTGGSSKSGYIKALMYDKLKSNEHIPFEFSEMVEPSQYIINKYKKPRRSKRLAK